MNRKPSICSKTMTPSSPGPWEKAKLSDYGFVSFYVKSSDYCNYDTTGPRNRHAATSLFFLLYVMQKELPRQLWEATRFKRTFQKMLSLADTRPKRYKNPSSGCSTKCPTSETRETKISRATAFLEHVKIAGKLLKAAKTHIFPKI